MVVGHLIFDTRSLLVCSLTCYSWYIAAVPHLHHTLTAPTWCEYVGAKRIWPKPLQDAHELGLLPLVQKFQVHRRDPKNFLEFSPERFNRRSLRHFLALTNVQELVIDCLDIPGFMPNIRQYFGHVFPTLRSLAMGEPKGSRRQIIYFIRLFRHLEDLEILYDKAGPEERPDDDVTLVPSFIPPLRGRLAMRSTRVDLLKDMIYLFGGIRSRYLDISNVGGTPLLLDSCAETLETLRLSPTDAHGKECSLSNARVLADDLSVEPLAGGINLSQNTSLQTLEFRAWHLDEAMEVYPLSATMDFLTHTLSSINSPLFSKVVLFYRDFDFRGIDTPWSGLALRQPSPKQVELEAMEHRNRFMMIRHIRTYRHFQLVLCADVWDGAGDYSVRSLEQAVAAEKARGGFSQNFPEPLVIHRPRGSRQNPIDYWTTTRIMWIPL